MKIPLRKKITLYLYILLRVISGLLLAYSIYKIIEEKIDEIESVYFFIALNALGSFILSFIPSIIERHWKVDLPEFLEVAFIVFCTCTLIIGEVGRLYEKTTWWDAIMHTLSGSLIAIFGFYLINILNKSEIIHLELRPITAVVFIFCITAAAGVIWEIIEYLVDYTTGSNMQRYFDDLDKEPFIGQAAMDDTMMDLILNSLGSLFICIPTYFDLKTRSHRLMNIIYPEAHLDGTH